MLSQNNLLNLPSQADFLPVSPMEHTIKKKRYPKAPQKKSIGDPIQIKDIANDFFL